MKTRHTLSEAIEQLVGTSIGGYLTRLETDYGLIARRQPFGEKSANKASRYSVADNFFAFWFRFVHRNADLIELKRFDALREILRRDYEVFSGLMLERYFRQKLAEQRTFTGIGSWWDRRGENEIDIVAEDKLSHRAFFAEVKRARERISLDRLKEKSEAFMRSTGKFSGWHIEYKALSLRDI